MMILVLYFLLHSLTLAERTPQESASLARNLLKTSKLCNLATIMSQTGPNPDLDGFPFSSLEYISDDCPSTGHPFVFLVSWGTHARNVKYNGNVSISLKDTQWYHSPSNSTSRGPMDHARLVLLGKLVPVPLHQNGHVSNCFFSQHPDAKEWVDAHLFQFYHLIVSKVYWIGGFGDEHYVGWISVHDYLSSSHAILELN